MQPDERTLMNQSNVRQSNFELLRIISILGVLCLHISGFFSTSTYPYDYFQINIIYSIFNICVTCFILISGYFGIIRKGEHLFHLWCIVIFYSILSIIIFTIFKIPISLEDFIKSLIPTISGKYWFFSPYINHFIDTLSQNQFKKFLLLLISIFYIAPTFFYFEITKDLGKGFINFFIVYLIGRYISLYKREIKCKNKSLVLLFSGIICLSFILNQISSYFKGVAFTPFSRDNSLSILIAAICIFYLFSRLHFYSKIINRIAANTFSIYISEVILRYTLPLGLASSFLFETPYIIPFILFSSLALFMICSILEFIRKLLFYRLEFIAYIKVSSFMNKLFEKIINNHHQ